MGIFKSIGKSFKKVFKKIGGAIKKQFKRVMKFVGKAGVLGQIAMMFVLPGIGGALMKGIGGAFKGLVGATAEGVAASAVTSQAAVTAGTAATNAVGTGTATATQTAAIKAGEVASKSLTKQLGKGILEGSIKGTLKATRGTGLLGSSSGLLNGVGTVLQAAGNFVKVGAKAFSTVTEGISSFIGEFGKTALNKIPGVNIGSAAPDFATAWSNVQGNVMTNASETLKAFNTSIGYTPPTTGGLANYKPTARVSVDSLQKASLQKQAATSGVKLLEGDGGTLTLPAGADLSQAADIKARALGQLSNGTQLPTVEFDPTVNAAPDVGVQAYKVPETNSLLSKQMSGNPPNFGAKTQATGPGINVEDLNFTELKDTAYKPNEAASYKLPGDFQGAMEQTAKAGLPNPPTTTFVATTPPPVAATDPSYFEMLKSRATDALKEFSPSSLLERAQKIPGQFLDNLGNTITKAPETAFYAQMNKQPAGYNVSTQVIGGPMPVADVSSLQPSTGGTAEQASEYYKGLQRSGTGSYGFASNDGYNQFMKKFG